MIKKVFLFLCVASLSACLNNDDDEFSFNSNQAEIDENIIEMYIEENNIVAQRHESGVYYVIDVSGSGGSPQLTNEVEVKYKGYFTDGEVFDETQGNNTIKFALNRLILGWQIGIPLLEKGGKGTFMIPSGLGYGPTPPPGIRPNAVLVFDIELVDFN